MPCRAFLGKRAEKRRMLIAGMEQCDVCGAVRGVGEVGWFLIKVRLGGDIIRNEALMPNDVFYDRKLLCVDFSRKRVFNICMLSADAQRKV